MMIKRFQLLFGILLAAFALAAQQNIPIIPKPVSLIEGGVKNVFQINANTQIVDRNHNDTLKRALQVFAQSLQHLSGHAHKFGKAKSNYIKVVISPIKDQNHPEAYQLQIDQAGVLIQANTARGAFYGLQSLLQLLPATPTNQALSLPKISILDYPRFQWRGMHLDVVRHFFTVEQVKQYIDLMAMYKMNTFHWHLTDDQGWRIEIKKYPLLTQTGAWRVDRRLWHFNDRPTAKAEETPNYGGFYTQEQVKDIVAYAAARMIQVVPEIELPGHSAAAIAAYPNLCCTGQKQLPLTGGDYLGKASNYCAGKEEVFTFLTDVIAEVMPLFPSPYFHIGGDEVEKEPWKACSACQKRMKDEQLKDEYELQSYFVKRIGKYIKANGKKMIGWDEILEGGLASDAVVMSWRGETGGIAAAKMAHEVVMTPGVPCYFDHYQADPESEPKAIGGFNTLKRVYDYEPVPAELGDSLSHFVLGAQANVWTEYMPSFNHVVYMILPRMPAMAEVLWSPKAKRSWQEFYPRIEAHQMRFAEMGLNYCKGNFKVDVKTFTQNKQLKAVLSSEIPNATILFSYSNRANMLAYTDTITIDTSGSIKAWLYRNKHQLSILPAEQKYQLHKGIGSKITYDKPVSKSYPAEGESTLVNGIFGPMATRSSWHAINKSDLSLTMELPEATEITRIQMNFLHFYKAWVFAPTQVEFSYSLDGIKWSDPTSTQNHTPMVEANPITQQFGVSLKPVKVKYIKIKAKNLGVCPAGHPGEGQGAWLFADEIVVE
jgi:hexosaminidase